MEGKDKTPKEKLLEAARLNDIGSTIAEEALSFLERAFLASGNNKIAYKFIYSKLLEASIEFTTEANRLRSEAKDDVDQEK
ncbi:MAG TPA: hypothetical protein VLG12_02810 [Candidatus Saccharimonadales bacterium]|nr:hypothetical protein [Candidatus Saccharimonadales bacterium]